MQNAPKSLRLHISVFGRTNVGKSSVINLISGQDVSIVSPVSGTTTDAVEKSMELPPLGPVLLTDTAGMDDKTILAAEREKAAVKVFDRTDCALLVCESGCWDDACTALMQQAKERNIPVIVIANKCDIAPLTEDFREMLLRQGAASVIPLCAVDRSGRDQFLAELKQALIRIAPEDFISPPPLLGDLLPENATVVLVCPIDLQAPKGRLILPQVQAIRDALDFNAKVIVCKLDQYTNTLELLKMPPDLVVCDSQVVKNVISNTPEKIPCTTFSILFSRLKGDLDTLIKGVQAVKNLKDGDRVLIAEACTHHALNDDIGRVKIPRWIREYTKKDVQFDVAAGHDYPENLSQYKLIVHCGGCMLNRREILTRISTASNSQIPITNYGICISLTQGVLDRVLVPFVE